MCWCGYCNATTHGVHGCNLCNRDIETQLMRRAGCEVFAELWLEGTGIPLFRHSRARQRDSDAITPTINLAVMLQHDALGFLALIGDPAACLL
jgi:hypothetical protein